MTTQTSTRRDREREGSWIAAFDDTEFEVPLLASMDDSRRRDGDGRSGTETGLRDGRGASVRGEGQTPSPPPPPPKPTSRTSVSAQYSPSTAASASTHRPTSAYTQSLSFAMGLMDSTGTGGEERDTRARRGGDCAHDAQEEGSAPSSPPVTPRETAPFLVLTSAQMGEGRNRGSALYDGPASPSGSRPPPPPPQQGPPPPPKGRPVNKQQGRPSNASSIETGSMSVVSSASTSLSASASSTMPLMPHAVPSSSSSSSTPLSQSHLAQTTGASGSGSGAPGSAPIPPTFGFVSPFARQSPRGSTNFIPHSTSGATHGSASATASGSGRGSMILYRLSAGEDDMLSASSSTNGLSALHALSMANAPPGLTSPTALGAWNNNNRNSAYSSDGDRDSAHFDGDSKYPVLLPGGGVGLQTPNRTPRGSVFRLGPGQRTPPLPGTPSPMGTMNAGKASAFTIGMRSSMAEVGDVGKVHGGLVAYVFDPEEEDDDEGEEERWMHDPSGVNPLYKGLGVGGGKGGGTVGSGAPTFGTHGTKVNASAKAGVHYANGTKGTPHGEYRPKSNGIPWRGIVNITTLVTLILGLLCLFMVYPITQIYTSNGVDARILGNTRINATGQAEGFVVNGNNGGNGVNNNLGVVGGHLEANLGAKGARTRREWSFERDEEGS